MATEKRRVRLLVPPTMPEQLELVTASLAKVTPESVGRVLAPLGLECRKLTHFTESPGVINPVFFVEAAPSGPADSTASVELVLRVTNPHPYWQEIKTAHEVAVMEFVSTHADPALLPVPRVLSFSSDASTSPLGSEFVLMEKITGQNLGDLWDKMEKEERRAYVTQIVQVMAELRRISAFLPERGVGGFDSRMGLAGLVQDGPPIGPFASFSDSVEDHIRWGLEHTQFTLRHEPELRQRLEELLTRYVDTVLESYRQSEAAQVEEFGLCHSDLNYSNILIDQSARKIVAILDWEKSKCSTYDDELRGVESSLEDDDELFSHLQEAMTAMGVTKPKGYNERKGLIKVKDRHGPLSWACFSCVTWFLPLREGLEELAEDERKHYAAHAKKAEQRARAACQPTG